MPTEWVIDTGATDHVSFTHSSFQQPPIPSSLHKSICVPNGHSVPIHGIGNAQITSDIILTDVLFVPPFKFNLLSVPKFTQTTNCSIFFYPDHCVFQDHLTKEIGRGHKKGGL